MNPVRSVRNVRGISLIELLVSMAIGLVVVSAVIVSYLGSGQASRHQSALTQMNQDAQIGLNMLSREIQLAGYSAPASVTVVAGPPSVTSINYHNLNCGAGACALANLVSTTSYIFGCDGTRGVSPFTSPTATALACGPAVGATSAGFGVVYEADVKNTAPTAGGVPTDCLGASIGATNPGANQYYVARNRFFIDVATGGGATGRPELFCASDKAGASKQPLLENVEDMQVWYGVSNVAVTQTAASRQVVRYAKAGAVNAAGAAEWDKVVSVRICLLMRSEEVVLTSAEDTLTYLDCDSNSQTSNDRYLRRAYYTTSTVRSKMTY